MKQKFFAFVSLAALICQGETLPQPLVCLDFETPEIEFCGLRKNIHLSSGAVVPGKFGKGAYFQRPAFNSVPREAALPSSLKPFSIQGKAMIKGPVLLFKGRELAIRDFFVRLAQEYINPFIYVTANCEIKASQKSKIRFCLDMTPRNLSEKEKKAILAKAKRKTPLEPDQNGNKEYTVDTDWKRIVVTARIDARIWQNRKVSLRILASPDCSLKLKHFQVEQTGNSPYNSTAPTGWLSGQTLRPDAECGILITEQLLQNAFPVNQGTFSWWAKMPEDLSLGKRSASMPHLAFAGGWRLPAWTLKTDIAFTGLKSSIASKRKIQSNRWSHFAVVWTETENRFYINGQLTNTSPRTPQKIDERGKYILSIGRSIWPKASSDAMLDEIYLFDQALSSDAIRILSDPQKPFRPHKTDASDVQSPRVLPFAIHPFYRDTTEEYIDLDILATKPEKIKVKLETFEKTSVTQSLTKGKNTIRIPIHPRKAVPHSGKLKLVLAHENGSVFFRYTQTYEVRPALRKELLRVLSWGGDGETPLEYLQKLGVNSINTVLGKWEKDATRLGMTINLDFRNFKYLEGNNFDVQKTLKETISPVNNLRGCYNWEGTLVNSEAFGTWKPADWPDKYPELIRLAGKALPQGLPQWDQFRLNPFMANLTDLPIQPDKNGVFPKMGKAADFLIWYMNDGNPVIQLNRANAGYIHSVSPRNIVWTEPADSYGVFKGLDMGGAWAYTASLQEVTGKLRRDWAHIRNAGCHAMQPTLTMYYWINSREMGTYKGQQYILTRSPERLQADCWVAAGATPMHNLCFFNAYAWYDAEKLQKKYLPALQPLQQPFERFMRERFYPAALLLRDTQEPPATVALCLPPEIKIYSEKSWHVYRASCMWERNLALHDIHFDVLYDSTPYQRQISSYKTAIFPMAARISKDYEDMLQKAAKTTQIVVDEHCLRNYPNMRRLKYRHNPAKAYQQETFQAIEPFLKELAQKDSGKSVSATGSKGRVMTFERLCSGIRLILVINNAWEPGPEYSFVNVKSPRDIPLYSKGVAQMATVRIRDAANAVIYDFHEGKEVQVRKENKDAVWSTFLAPGDARLFCIYPQKIGKLNITVSQAAAGTVMNAKIDMKPAVGRQILWCEVRNAKGILTDESGWYVAEKGKCIIPVRIPLNGPAGQWEISVQEKTSALKCTKNWIVLPDNR